MKLFIVYFISFCLFGGASVFAGEEHFELYEGTVEFEKMKQLEGTWKGTSTWKGETKETTVEYEVTSAGSALLEKISPGTDHEMVSIYHDKQGALSMTHFCALKNQPQLKLSSVEGNAYQFSFSPTPGIEPAKDAHMNSLRIEFDGEDSMTQSWTMLENGEAGGASVVSLKRVVT